MQGSCITIPSYFRWFWLNLQTRWTFSVKWLQLVALNSPSCWIEYSVLQFFLFRRAESLWSSYLDVWEPPVISQTESQPGGKIVGQPRGWTPVFHCTRSFFFFYHSEENHLANICSVFKLFCAFCKNKKKNSAIIRTRQDLSSGHFYCWVVFTFLVCTDG